MSDDDHYVSASESTPKILCKLTLMALPVVGGFAFYPAYTFIDTAILGNFEDQTYLVSFGLAISASAILIESVLVSASCVVETLVSQAYGAGDHKLCRIYLNR